MAKHDVDRVSPSGDEIKAMLEAEGKPVLLLLDEVLKYMERAAAVGVKESTLQRQAKDFIQNLTVEVANTHQCRDGLLAAVEQSRGAGEHRRFSRNWTISTSRIDQVREPVTGDEVLAVVAATPRGRSGRCRSQPSRHRIQQRCRRVLAGEGRNTLGQTGCRRTHRATQDRMQAAYPFHPALIDIMNSRWTSTDFQRTRVRCVSWPRACIP